MELVLCGFQFWDQFLFCFLSILGPRFGVQEEPQDVIFRFRDLSFFGSRFVRPLGAVSKVKIWIPCGESHKNQVSPKSKNVSKNGPKWEPKSPQKRLWNLLAGD